jgi:hypothetical protein
MNESFVVSRMEKGRIKKKEYKRKELEVFARKCCSAHHFASSLMGITLTEITNKIDDAIHPKTYTVVLKETGKEVAGFYWTRSYEELVEKVKTKFEGKEVEIRQAKKNYYQKRRYEALKREFEYLADFYNDLGVFNHYTPIEQLWHNMNDRMLERFPIYRLYQLMAERLDIIGYKEERDYSPMDSTWYRELGLMGRGLEFITKDGKAIYLFMGFDEGRTLYIDQFGIRERGQGLGTKIMMLFKEFVDSINGEISVMRVCNQKFFDRFDWLVPTCSGMFYDYKPRRTISD